MTEFVRIWKDDTHGVMEARTTFDMGDVVGFEEYVYDGGVLAEHKPLMYVVLRYDNPVIKMAYDDFKILYDSFLKLRGEQPITLKAN